jgi:hypothetical protein
MRKMNPLKKNMRKMNPLKKNMMKMNPLKKNMMKMNPLKKNMRKMNLWKKNPSKKKMFLEMGYTTPSLHNKSAPKHGSTFRFIGSRAIQQQVPKKPNYWFLF